VLSLAMSMPGMTKVGANEAFAVGCAEQASWVLWKCSTTQALGRTKSDGGEAQNWEWHFQATIISESAY